MAQKKTGSVSHFSLRNGLDVVVIPDHRAPVVTHMIYYRNGAADDPIGKSGIAHFLEHLMFKGTQKHPRGVFSEIVADLGGQENAFTGHDYTAYYQRVAKEHLGRMMELEADRMTGLVLRDKEVLSEREVILEERKMHVDADPGSQLYESLSATLFTHHPYGIPIIGWEHEIAALNRSDALAYYGRFYTPENAILIVAGDVEKEAVKALAEATYGQVPRQNSAPKRQRHTEPKPVTERLVALTDQKVEQPAVYRMYLAPSHVTAKGNDAYALEVLDQVIGSSSSSLLYRALVMEQKIAVGVQSWYRADALDDGYFGIHATPAENVPLDRIDAAIDQVVADVLAKGVSAADLKRAKTRLVADLIYAQDNQAHLARIYGTAFATGGDAGSIQDWPDHIEQVTNADIKRVARDYLVRRRSVVGHLKKAA